MKIFSLKNKDHISHQRGLRNEDYCIHGNIGLSNAVVDAESRRGKLVPQGTNVHRYKLDSLIKVLIIFFIINTT